MFKGQKWLTAQAIGAKGSKEGHAFPAGQGVQSQLTPVPAKEYVPGGQIKALLLVEPSGQ